ncbi:FAD-dependent monooxygenase [Rivibacter subsaxonicus]|uniref:Ubiquinone biosynthesis UbiH/UbiF/VisC/COQ6 family hydroxylase n=1 Tax=Rivibacter subsaxonicus TaxID=457575 RepID=A0A4Q7VGP3_9BURK|nr:FAD-dependent monooxygenase [Rivibacter subsaxonicus]RZT95216.1 ubiquinone biosynthesis UbiH/UbiF/VisC/COQ6 family hydroxylase [Rivibacter subsaxonicus]
MNGFDVCVLGRGAVGQALALSLGRLGLSVALVAPARPDTGPGAADVRTYALGASSIALLDQLKVWDAVRAARPSAATRVLDMQVRGDGAGAGALNFSAWQQGVGELAWIVDAAVLERELANALRFAPHVQLLDAAVEAPLTAICEGKDGATRAALGIETERFDYGQTAVAARLGSERPHQGIARQWFGAPDVLALLPFDLADGPGYGLVWSLPDERARTLLAVEPAAFEAALAEATQGAAGPLRLQGERAAWPLRVASARRWHGRWPGRADAAWVLLGDAAHVVHPLAGQGLNLGLADVRTLAEVLAERQRGAAWRPLSDERLLARYARRRIAPTWAMTRLTDGLQKLFAEPAPLLRQARNRGLSVVESLPPLKRWLAARALAD